MSESIGNGIKEIREILGLSRDELAATAGFSAEEITAFELGLIEPPKSEVEAIASAMSVPVSFIVMFADPSDDPLLDQFKRTTRKLLKSIAREASNVSGVFVSPKGGVDK